MKWSNSVFSLRLIAATGLAFALLAGCKPHAEHGTFDEANAITVVDVAKLGLVEAKKRYEGKIVTFKGPLEPTGVRGKNSAKKNTCIQGFIRDFSSPSEKGIPSSVPGTEYRDGNLYVYFNFEGDLQPWMKQGMFTPEFATVDNPIAFEEDMCDREQVCSEGDLAGDRKCKFSSDRLLIAGKVMAVYEESEGKGVAISLLPTGLRY